MPIKEDTNITRVTGLVCTPDPADPSNGLFPPILSQDQIDAIPEDEIQYGGLAFNEGTQELQTYSAADEWVNVITDGSDEVTFNELTVTTLTVTGVATIDNLTVTNNLTVGDNITTDNLLVNDTANIDTLNVINDELVSGDLTVQGFTNLQDLRIGSFNNGGTLAGSTNIGGVSQITYVAGTAAGTSPVFTVQGSPISGNIRMTAGSSPSGTTVATFTLPNTAWKQFSSSYWAVSLTPLNANAAGADAGGNIRAYVSNVSASDANTAATFRISVDADTPLIADEDYHWHYLIIGNSYVA